MASSKLCFGTTAAPDLKLTLKRFTATPLLTGHFPHFCENCSNITFDFSQIIPKGFSPPPELCSLCNSGDLKIHWKHFTRKNP